MLRIPEASCSQKTRAGRMEGFCMLLNRMAHPCQLKSMVRIFGRSISEISLIVNYMLDYIYDEFCMEKLSAMDRQNWVTNNLAEFANAVSNQGSPLPNCVCFIDGTVRPISRPTYLQREVYSGHKRTHGLKYQSVVTPNGLVAEMSGPYPARRHDSWVMAQTQLLERLGNLPGDVYGYGDPAYNLSPNLLCPYKGAELSNTQKDFNAAMSSVRVCVEWVFGKITNLWPYIDNKKSQNLYKQPLAKQYLVCTFLTNLHTMDRWIRDAHIDCLKCII